MTALPNKQYNGHHRATKTDGDQKIHGKKIWRKKWTQQLIQLEEDGGGSTAESWMWTRV